MADFTLRLKLLISIITFSIVIISCEKPKVNLPSKTHEGKNTYGYDLIISDSSSFRFIGDLITGEDITADSANNYSIRIYNLINGLYFDKVYDLTIEINNNFEFNKAKLVHANDDYTIDSTQLNYTEITYLDSNKRILSGYFEFNLVYLDSSFSSIDSTWTYRNIDSLQVKNGRFDLNY